MTARPFFLRAAIVVAALAGVVAVLLPPRAAPAVAPAFRLTWPVARGAYHVHSRRSDGTGTVDDIAAAAARAGLAFVILTDHGDGTRAPEPPAYRAGVLCIDAVEISTNDGHYVAIDLPQAPYRLAGDAHAVVEDVRRFGGFGIAAHPASAKPALAWRDWSTRFDGIEWLNADSEWRDEFWGSLGTMLVSYPFRPAETLAALLDRPAGVFERWNALARERRVAGLAAADAHARIGYRQATDPYEDLVVARVPSYEASFRAFVNHVILPAPLTGDAQHDARSISGAIREGHVFTSIDGLAALSAFEAKATSGNAAATPGAYLDITAPVAIEAVIAAPSGTTMSVWRNDELVYETRDPALRVDVGREPGAYRIEARLATQGPGESIPWLLTNPIYVGLRDFHARAAASGLPEPAATRAAIATGDWTAEASEGSTSVLRPTALEDGTPALAWHFALADGRRGSQFAAMRFPVSARLQAHARLQLRARSDRPRRIWAQLRTAGSAGGERWGTTFYLDSDLQEVDLRFADFRPLDRDATGGPPLERVDSLLLVVDTVNSVPGTSGLVAVTDLWLAR